MNKRNLRHGHARRGAVSPTWRTWNSMVRRCTDPSAADYQRYGARGVSVCERWLSFDNFLSDMGERPEGTTLDRKNNTKGYEPKNCRWATSIEQSRNRRSNNVLTYGDRSQCLSAWAEEFGLNKNTLHARLYRYGWSVEKALSTPPDERKRRTK